MKRLLVIDDEVDVVYSFRRIFEAQGFEISEANSGEEGIETLADSSPDVVIMDVRMGGMNGLETLRRIREKDKRLPVIMMTAYGTTQTAIEAMKLGAFDYVLKPFDLPKLQRLVESAYQASVKMKKPVILAPQGMDGDDRVGIVGQSEAMQTALKLVGQLAGSDATALITGESGTGKELIARAIYAYSSRASQPFLALNCAAIPEELLESELFGHEKGAFTGAVNQRIGKFEQCDGGTLFLDEIGDMPFPTQAKILRALQEGVFERVGGSESVTVNVRVVAATNRDLETAVAQREFREDLFYRLNVVRIHVPALRERKDDIPALVNWFLKKTSASGAAGGELSITEDALEALKAYHWPGNVRELENTIRRAAVTATGGVVMRQDLPQWRLPGPSTEESRSHREEPTTEVAAAASASEDASSAEVNDEIVEIGAKLFRWARQDDSFQVIAAVERQLVIQALRETGGNQVQAAKLLGITRATLRKRIERFGIEVATTIA